MLLILVLALAATKINFKAVARLDALDIDRLTMLYRVAQEALTNVQKHAKATEVSVVLRKIRGGACLEIVDNGQAFDVGRLSDTSHTHRLGLTSMRERVEMFGGQFSVTSTPGTGTTVRAEVFSARKHRSR